MNEENEERIAAYESYQPHLQPVDDPKGKFAKINTWLKNHNKPVLIALVILILAIGGGVIYLFTTLKFDTVSPLSTKRRVEKIYSPLTGLEVSEEDSKRPVTAVMVENSPEARPQSGLAEAGVVFEAVAEGGITRFLMLYQESKPSSIGPVRSVRPHFASWVAAFDAGLAHVGGSDIALKKLRSGSIRDLDEFANSKAYTRVNDRAAPHNVYTSDEKLQALNQSKGFTSSNFTAWTRDPKLKALETPTASSISVPVSTGKFSVSYSWDKETNTYPRQVGGAAHSDREKGQIAPRVVIVFQVPHDVIRDSNGYSYPDVNTSGKAWLFQNGGMQEISWSKASDDAQISFKDAEGKDVTLAAGQTWLTAIRPDKTPTWE